MSVYRAPIDGNAEQRHAAICLHPVLAGPPGGADHAEPLGPRQCRPNPARVNAIAKPERLWVGPRTRHDRGDRSSAASDRCNDFPPGKVSLTGFLVIPNTGAANRPVHGKVTISNAQGSITVCLRGTLTVYKGSLSIASGNLTNQIVSGSKADHGATGTGPVSCGPGSVFNPAGSCLISETTLRRLERVT